MSDNSWISANLSGPLKVFIYMITMSQIPSIERLCDYVLSNTTAELWKKERFKMKMVLLN